MNRRYFTKTLAVGMVGLPFVGLPKAERVEELEEYPKPEVSRKYRIPHHGDEPWELIYFNELGPPTPVYMFFRRVKGRRFVTDCVYFIDHSWEFLIDRKIVVPI